MHRALLEKKHSNYFLFQRSNKTQDSWPVYIFHPPSTFLFTPPTPFSFLFFFSLLTFQVLPPTSPYFFPQFCCVEINRSAVDGYIVCLTLFADSTYPWQGVSEQLFDPRQSLPDTLILGTSTDPDIIQSFFMGSVLVILSSATIII